MRLFLSRTFRFCLQKIGRLSPVNHKLLFDKIALVCFNILDRDFVIIFDFGDCITLVQKLFKKGQLI